MSSLLPIQIRKHEFATSGLLLLLAIIFEVTGTTAMKLSNGFSAFMPSICIFIFYGISFVFLAWTLKKLEVSAAYAIWSGLGTFLIACIGIFYFHETVSVIKIISLILIVTGVVGLRWSQR